LTEREAQAARAADEDKLTGLSNHGKTMSTMVRSRTWSGERLTATALPTRWRWSLAAVRDE